jgi:hypothetical protein
MGQPVVHFEIIGKDAEKLMGYYSELFGWEFNADNPMNYGTVDREANTNADGIGIGGSLGGSRMMGPEKVTEGIEVGLFNDPEGRTVGVVKTG